MDTFSIFEEIRARIEIYSFSRQKQAILTGKIRQNDHKKVLCLTGPLFFLDMVA